MLKPNKPRVSALAGHLPEKQRYLWSCFAGKSAFKNIMIVSWILLIVLIYFLFSGSAKIKIMLSIVLVNNNYSMLGVHLG